jgi:hypothetical protein
MLGVLNIDVLGRGARRTYHRVEGVVCKFADLETCEFAKDMRPLRRRSRFAAGWATYDHGGGG